jgi:RNA polymerase sigma factor (TIGR02999 family)
MSDVTQILSAIRQGDTFATDQLLLVVYDELRKLAAQKMAQEKPGQTLQATALVHEAYLRLVQGDVAKQWDSRGHFFAAAAEAMRRILIEQARRKKSLRRGGEFSRIELDAADLSEPSPTSQSYLALDEALTKLSDVDAEAATLVKLRFFAGLTVDEAAEALGVSSRTAKRNWAFARAWLQREIEQQ